MTSFARAAHPQPERLGACPACFGSGRQLDPSFGVRIRCWCCRGTSSIRIVAFKDRPARNPGESPRSSSAAPSGGGRGVEEART